MVNGFLGLGHYAVVGRDDQHHDVGNVSAASAHPGERFMTRRIDEDDLSTFNFNVIGADVLGDAAGLAARDVRFPDGVEQ